MYEYLTDTLVMNFLKASREANPYFQLGYIPQTILYHTQRQVLKSMNTDLINIRSKSTIKFNKKQN